jgi:hypothetical protein
VDVQEAWEVQCTLKGLRLLVDGGLAGDDVRAEPIDIKGSMFHKFWAAFMIWSPEWLLLFLVA